MFLTFFSVEARVLFWFHGVLFCASSFWPIICSCISLARSLTQFLDSLSLPLPDCVLRSAYYGSGRGKSRVGTVGNGKGVYCWALAFVLFAVLRAVSAAAAACLYYSLSLSLLLLQLCFGFWFNAFDLNT